VQIHQLDALARSIGTGVSRRGLGRAFRGGALAALISLAFGASESTARRKRRKRQRRRQQRQRFAGCTPRCDGKLCGDDGCGGVCGACGLNQRCQDGECVSACPAGQTLLSNGTCAVACNESADCIADCGASACSGPNAEEEQYCIVEGASSGPCESTVDCPPGFHCQGTEDKTCRQLCRPA
jgi:hypothetical protein